MIDQLLDLYGHEEHTGRGAIIIYFAKANIRRMERDLGRRPVARLSEWLDAYKVVSTDGATLTTGHRTRHIRRKG